MNKKREIKVWFAGLVISLLMTAVLGTAGIYYYMNLMQQPVQEEVDQELDYVPGMGTLEKLQGYHYVLARELYLRRASLGGQYDYQSYRELFFEENTENFFPKAQGLYAVEEDLQREYQERVDGIKNHVERYLSGLENQEFATFNSRYDYWVEELQQKKGSELVLTNTEYSTPSLSSTEYAWLYQVSYDDTGVATISDLLCASAGDRLEQFRKNVNAVLHKNPLLLMGAYVQEDMGYLTSNAVENAVFQATRMKNPVNCRITIGISRSRWQELCSPEKVGQDWDYWYSRFNSRNVDAAYLVVLLLTMAAGVFWMNPRTEEKREKRRCFRLPAEIVLITGYLLIFGAGTLYADLTRIWFGYWELIAIVGLRVWFFYFCAWYVGGCLGECAVSGISQYLKKRSILMYSCGWIQRKWKTFLQIYRETELGQDLRKKLAVLFVANAGILMLLCCLWFFGAAGVAVYSVVLYLLVIRYLDKIQKQYRALQQMTREMAAGNLKVEPEEEAGLFAGLQADLVSIRDGFDKAVQEEVKSQKMKSELITNVSHDLKTPLTAIITYISLLKEEGITEEERRQYLDTLDKKSLRLKTLIEDLFEVSKASTGNVQLNLQDCDLVNLLKQVSLEMQDKLETRRLVTRLMLPEEKIILSLDSEKTFRIYENLLGNVAKYAMEGTRVYVELTREEEEIRVVIKNITEAELMVSPEELTERFVRGDASRGTVEGSGLGLAIVRSFTELQGGELKIDVDGDLFKVTTIWKKKA